MGRSLSQSISRSEWQCHHVSLQKIYPPRNPKLPFTTPSSLALPLAPVANLGQLCLQITPAQVLAPRRDRAVEDKLRRAMGKPPVAIVPDGSAVGVDLDNVAESFADVAKVDAAGVAAGTDDEDSGSGAHCGRSLCVC